jgi:hypothetical protein
MLVPPRGKLVLFNFLVVILNYHTDDRTMLATIQEPNRKRRRRAVAETKEEAAKTVLSLNPDYQRNHVDVYVQTNDDYSLQLLNCEREISEDRAELKKDKDEFYANAIRTLKMISDKDKIIKAQKVQIDEYVASIEIYKKNDGKSTKKIIDLVAIKFFMGEEIDELKNKIVELIEENEKMKAEVVEVKEENYEIKRENVELKTQIEMVKSENVEVKEENANGKKLVVDLKSYIEATKELIADLGVESDHMRKDIVVLKTDNEILKRDNVGLKTENETLDKSNTNNMKNLNKLLIENISLKCEVDKLSTESTNLRNEIDDMITDNSNLGTETETVKLENAELTKEKEKMLVVIAGLEEEVERLKEELTRKPLLNDDFKKSLAFNLALVDFQRRYVKQIPVFDLKPPVKQIPPYKPLLSTLLRNVGIGLNERYNPQLVKKLLLKYHTDKNNSEHGNENAQVIIAFRDLLRNEPLEHGKNVIWRTLIDRDKELEDKMNNIDEEYKVNCRFYSDQLEIHRFKLNCWNNGRYIKPETIEFNTQWVNEALIKMGFC